MTGSSMEVSNPDKLLFPDDGITKRDVVGHYRTVAEAVLRFCGGRPLTLQRFPQGIGAKGFMQKNAADHFPDSIERLPVPKRGGGHTVYPVVHNVEDVPWLANQNTVTFHMWTSSARRPGHPDWLVIDLDPEADNAAGARAAATVVGRILEDFDLEGFPLATGSKGFHVWVPLDGTQTFGAVSSAARALAGLAVVSAPEAMTLEFLKKNRGGRVFVDWLRNGPTATVVVPFSLRPRPGAPVAVPLTWDELQTTVPDRHRIGAVEHRLDAVAAIRKQTVPVAEIEAAARVEGVDLDTPRDRFGR